MTTSEPSRSGSEFCEACWRIKGEHVAAIYWIDDETGQRFFAPGEGRSGVCADCDDDEEDRS